MNIWRVRFNIACSSLCQRGVHALMITRTAIVTYLPAIALSA
jgi:hypothetical protein